MATKKATTKTAVKKPAAKKAPAKKVAKKPAAKAPAKKAAAVKPAPVAKKKNMADIYNTNVSILLAMAVEAMILLLGYLIIMSAA